MSRELKGRADAGQAELLRVLDLSERAELVRLLERVLSSHPAQPA